MVTKRSIRTLLEELVRASAATMAIKRGMFEHKGKKRCKDQGYERRGCR